VLAQLCMKESVMKSCHDQLDRVLCTSVCVEDSTASLSN